MRLEIGCIDGHTYSSDEVNEDEVLAELKETGGVVGTGPFEDITVTTIEEFEEFMLGMALGDLPGMKDMNLTSFSLNFQGGTRKFKPDAIIWAQVYR